MMTSPTTTGSEPRSPERTRSKKAADRAGNPALVLHALVAAIERAWRSTCRSTSAVMAAAPAACSRCGLARSARRETALFVGAGDGADQFLVRGVGREDAVVAAEPQHDDPVGDGAHVLHVVADHDARRGRGRERVRSGSAPPPSARRQGRRSARRAGSASARAASERAIATVCRWPPDSEATGFAHARDARRQLVEQRPGADLHRHLVEPQRTELRPRKMLATTSRFSQSARSWKTVAMPSVSAALGSASVTGLPSKVMVPEARLMDAGEDLDQRRLAGAVVADQRDDLAGMDVEIDVGQRRDGAEILGDAAQAEDQLARARPFRRRCRLMRG